MTFLEGTLNTCKPLVNDQARPLVDVAWEQWRTNNEAEMAAFDRGRSRLISAAKASGVASELEAKIEASTRSGMQEARESIESLPSERQAGKCYGILTALNEGELDIAHVAAEDLKILAR